MSTKYRKLTATMIVKASAVRQVKQLLAEAVEIIASDEFIYQYSVADERVSRPRNAVDHELDTSD